MLAVEDLSVDYGGLHALRQVSLNVGGEEVVSIIGPNGAGKTTLFKAISGTVGIASGRITYEGADLRAVPPARRAHMGIAHVPEGRRVFPTMTVEENLEMGGASADRQQRRDRLASVFELFPVLAERRRQVAGTLSGGEQQMVAIGRGLMTGPRLLLLDEPSMGLAPAIADTIFDRVQEIAASGVATVLVEQRATDALEIAERGYVLENGEIVLSGSTRELKDSDRVRQAYLGM
jgi:branched-chain amino acid transport system ATP-binding protein